MSFLVIDGVTIDAAGALVDGLPPGMGPEEPLAWIQARLTEHDRYVIALEDGYLVSRPAGSGAPRRRSRIVRDRPNRG
jgi:hypothetical protein